MKIVKENIQVVNVSMELNKALSMYRRLYGIIQDRESERSELQVLTDAIGNNVIETIGERIYQNKHNNYINDKLIGDRLTLKDKVELSAKLREYLEEALDYMRLLETKYQYDLEQEKVEI